MDSLSKSLFKIKTNITQKVRGFLDTSLLFVKEESSELARPVILFVYIPLGLTHRSNVTPFLQALRDLPVNKTKATKLAFPKSKIAAKTTSRTVRCKLLCGVHFQNSSSGISQFESSI